MIFITIIVLCEINNLKLCNNSGRLDMTNTLVKVINQDLIIFDDLNRIFNESCLNL